MACTAPSNSRQSPTVTSPTRPPLAAMMTAIRPNPVVLVAGPAGSCSQRASSAAHPCGSRQVAIRAARFFGMRGASSHPNPGRITSPQIRAIAPAVAASRSRFGSADPQPVVANHSCTVPFHAVLVTASPPLASHRSCQLSPGNCSSQSSTLTSPACCSRWVCSPPLRNGATCSRASTRSRRCRVAAQSATGGRGGNCLISVPAAGPGTIATSAQGPVASVQGPVAATAGCAAITSGPSRTTRSATRLDTPSRPVRRARVDRSHARPGGPDGRTPRR